MFPPLFAVTICWTGDASAALQVLQTTAYGIAAIACLSMPWILYRARQQAGPGMVRFLLVTAAFSLCIGLNQGLSGLALWTEDFTPDLLETLWAITTAMICVIAARSLHHHAADLLATRQELVSIRALAKTDPLTGLENRQGFNDGLEQAIQNSQEQPHSSTLMLLDLDGFKAVNDTHGHLVGDHILQRIAQILKRHARSADCVARLGGDEFAIVWNHCSLENAKFLAENIRQDVAELWLPQIASQKSVVTASIGLSVIDAAASATGMYEITDRTLYISKRDGKNQVSWMPLITGDQSANSDQSSPVMPAPTENGGASSAPSIMTPDAMSPESSALGKNPASADKDPEITLTVAEEQMSYSAVYPGSYGHRE